MDKDVNEVVQTVSFDPTVAAAALARIEPLLAQENPTDAPRMSVEPQDAAIVALGAVELLRQPEVRERMGALPPDVFRPEWLDLLRDAALATWHARSEVVDARAISSRARLPEPLVQRAMELRGRMLLTVQHYLGDNPEVMARLETIRASAGHRDLAADLYRLNKLYKEHHALLSTDQKTYRASDVGDSDGLAMEIAQLLGRRSRERSRWVGVQLRCWSLLVRLYNQVRAVALFVHQDDPALREQLPSIIAGSRRSRGVSKDVTVGGDGVDNGDALLPASANTVDPAKTSAA